MIPQDLALLKDAQAAEKFQKRLQVWMKGRVSHHKYLRGGTYPLLLAIRPLIITPMLAGFVGVVLVENIPRSPSGKILRRLLRERSAAEREDTPKNRMARL